MNNSYTTEDIRNIWTKGAYMIPGNLYVSTRGTYLFSKENNGFYLFTSEDVLMFLGVYFYKVNKLAHFNPTLEGEQFRFVFKFLYANSLVQKENSIYNPNYITKSFEAITNRFAPLL